MEAEENKNDGILVDCSALFEGGEEGEQRLYETLRAIAEESPEREISALVSCDQKEKTETQIKAVFRAAVYGEISLLFGDVFTNEDAEEAKECAQRSFRSLLEEGREFNGFIPKGILIDTPFALLSKISEQGFDFFCLDEKRLIRLFVGASNGNEVAALQILNDLCEKNLQKISKKVLTKRKNMI
ncbi:MAG: hypothetical protein IJD64_04810 [Clostridia bacterium]|nr:hypothetical protein [Clostridia bacterium]